MSQRIQHRSSCRIAIIAFAIPFILCLLLPCTVTLIMLWQSNDISFCNTDNELYTYFAENIEEIAQSFPVQYEVPGAPDRAISLPGGYQFILRSIYGLTRSEGVILYVATRNDNFGFAADPIGHEGLFFTPTGELPDSLIEVTAQLGDGLYCYKLKSMPKS